MPENLNRSRLSTRNYILNALPPEDLERILPDLEPVDMPSGKILYHPDELITHIYFPNTAIASVVSLTAEGLSIEAGTIGFEGIAGFNVLMGVDSMPNENIVQLAGDGFRMTAAAAQREFGRSGIFQKLVLSFVHLLIAQMGQTSLCNRLHTSEERLSRWLLICHDRAASDELKLTQEFLGIMLGSNRSTVTISAISLQGAGFIKYARGRITILNREGLEDFTCGCYKTVKNEYDRVQNQ